MENELNTNGNPTSFETTKGSELLIEFDTQNTQNDEMIARLLQQEFDNEIREGSSIRERRTLNPTVNVKESSNRQSEGPVSAHTETSPHHESTIPIISEARDIVKSKITELITFIKSENPIENSMTPPITPLNSSSPTSAFQEVSPFDFNRFLDQMRDRRALPLTKYFRSFIKEFNKRSWTVNEQVKIVRDFLDFMQVQISQNEIFLDASETDVQNANEGMEKLVMNKLHDRCFSPITADDRAKDDIIFKKLFILQWIEFKHLDIKIPFDLAEPFLKISQKELLKMNDYKTPRDKLICILNACKVLFGLLKQCAKEENADGFLPLLIYSVLQSNPPQLISNLQYISRYRNPNQLQSEGGYYLTNVYSAVTFLENVDHHQLTVSKEDFEINISEKVRILEIKETQQTAPEYSKSITPSPNPSNEVSTSLSLDQFANNAKKPLEVLSKWFQEATSTISSRESVPNNQSSRESNKMPIQLSNMTPEERAILIDYDLQLAMAISMSLEEERGKISQDSTKEDAIDLIDLEPKPSSIGSNPMSSVGETAGSDAKI